MRRIAGPNLFVSQAVQNAAIHDLQRFQAEELRDWGISDDDQVVIKVHWQGFDDDEDTWEPLAQLHQDIPVMVSKYVQQEANEQLTAALTEIKARNAGPRRTVVQQRQQAHADAARRVSALIPTL